MKLIIAFLLLIISVTTGYSQSSDGEDGYEAWRKRKAREYARWERLKNDAEGLPSSGRTDRVSGWIDEGFNGSGTSGSGVNSGGGSHQAHSSGTGSQVSNNNSASYGEVAGATTASVANMRIWAVVVGVADYQSQKSKLNYTDDDAYRMYAFYKSPEGGSLPDNQVRVLIDEDATRQNVLRALNEVWQQASANDAIVFYFSGHGASNAFVTYEFNGDVLGNRGLLLHDEINALIAKSRAKYKYIIADACHSGNWATRSSDYDNGSGIRSNGVKAASTTEQAYYQAFEHAEGGFVMLLSSMGSEYSVESAGIRQGVFSHYLIRGLKGEADADHNRIVTVNELYNYVSTNVAQRTNRQQHPVISGDYRHNPPISVVRE